MSTVAIVGSRSWPDLEVVRSFVAALPEGTTVVSGGAIGVDETAELAARVRGLPVVIYPADWNKYGKRAGPMRNQEIVDRVLVNGGRLVAFHAIDPKTGKPSTGTASTIRLATKGGVPVEVITPEMADTVLDTIPLPPDLEKWLANIREIDRKLQVARWPAQRAQLLVVVANRVGLLKRERDALVVKLEEGWRWLDAHSDHPKFADTEAHWLLFLKQYEAVATLHDELAPRLLEDA